MDTKGKAVVGVDGSESSVQALRLAARLAPALEAAVHAVAVWELPPVYADETGYVPPDVDATEAIEAAEAAEAKILADTVAKAFGTEIPRNLSQELLRGPARDKLVEAGAGAALLIVGRRGHGGFLGMQTYGGTLTLSSWRRMQLSDANLSLRSLPLLAPLRIGHLSGQGLLRPGPAVRGVTYAGTIVRDRVFL